MSEFVANSGRRVIPDDTEAFIAFGDFGATPL